MWRDYSVLHQGTIGTIIYSFLLRGGSVKDSIHPYAPAAQSNCRTHCGLTVKKFVLSLSLTHSLCPKTHALSDVT